MPDRAGVRGGHDEIIAGAATAAAATTGPQRPAVAPGAVPRWFARILVVVLAVVLGFGAVGLVLAMLGWCRPVVVFPLGALAAAALARLGWHTGPGDRSPAARTWTVLAVLVIAATTAVNAANAGEHVVVNRDPGVYLVTGRWVAEHGSLVVAAAEGPFATADDLVFQSPGTYDEGGGHLQFQFSHLVPVLLAEAHWVGGDGLARQVPVVLGAAALLASYALAARLAGRHSAGFIVVALLAWCLPIVAAVRDTYSEPLTWLLLAGGLWAYTRGVDGRRPATALLAGLALGAAAAARVDAIVYLVPIPVLVALLMPGRDEPGAGRTRRTAVSCLVGLAPGIVIGAVDLAVLSREYLQDLRAETYTLWAALVLSVAAAAVLRLTAVRRRLTTAADSPGRRSAGWRMPAATAGAIAVVVVGLLLWFVRPQVEVARSSRPFEYIGAMQAAEGEPVEPDRRYDERSVQWLAWYLGPPAVAAAIAGAAIVVHRAGRGPLTPIVVPWLVLGGGTLLYLWRPSITPDHVWASRRFVPAVLPLAATLAAVTVTALTDGVRGRARRRWPRAEPVDRRWRRAVPALFGVASFALLLVPVVDRFRPVAALSDQRGYLAITRDVCAVVAGDAVIAIDGERAGSTLPQTLRSYCDVPVALLPAGAADPAPVSELAAAWAAADGRQLHLIAATEEAVAALVPGADIRRLGPYVNDHALEATVTRVPARLFSGADEFFVAAVPVAS